MTGRAGGAFVILVGAAVVAVVALGIRYHGAPVPGRVDSAVDTWAIDAVAGRRWVALAVSTLGTVEVVGVLAFALGTALAVARRAGDAALVVLAPLFATILAEWLLKPWVGRTLEGDFSFPSGHTCRLAALVVALVLVAGRLGFRRWVVGVVAALGIAAVAAVGAAMVAAGYHYATDTVAGVLVGSAVALLTVLVVDLVGSRSAAVVSSRRARGRG
jgi:undecaprenyl-diphosphatase